jgi:hypothetical protein
MIAAVVATTSAAAAVSAGQELPQVRHHQLMTAQCQPLWVIPAAWCVVLPGGTTFVIRNADPRHQGLAPSGGLITCQGRLGAARPSYLTP